MYVVASINFKKKVLIKSRHATRKEAEEARDTRMSKLFGMAAETYFHVFGPRQLKKKIEEQKAATQARKKKGQDKAAKTREKNKAKGKKPKFILCPTCNAKSKKLYSEMGGMQTRQCKNGHQFEVDTFFGFETSKRPIVSAMRTPFDSIDTSYMRRRYGDAYKGSE